MCREYEKREIEKKEKMNEIAKLQRGTALKRNKEQN